MASNWKYFQNGLVERQRHSAGDGEYELRLRESHTVGYRDPAGEYVNGHRTRDAFFRTSPKQSTACQDRANPCEQRWSYDGADRVIEEDNGHGLRTTFELTPAGGVEARRNAATGATISSATFDGTRMATHTKGGVQSRIHYDIEGNVDCITTPDGTQNDCDNSSSKVRECPVSRKWERSGRN